MSVEYRKVLEFWFEDLKPEDWFSSNEELDRTIKDKFGEVHKMAAACELDGWRTGPMGRLAEIIVLDQFSRNIYRNDPLAYAWDPLALALSQEAIRLKAHEELSSLKRSFLYMPYMHSESPRIHREAMELFSEPGLDYQREFEIKHKEVIDRFGRYPHRNLALGRESTAEELQFIKDHPNPYAP
jgi:uncharacterized protein (DUF924 family)